MSRATHSSIRSVDRLAVAVDQAVGEVVLDRLPQLGVAVGRELAQPHPVPLADAAQLVDREHLVLVLGQLDRELPALRLEDDAEDLDALLVAGGDELAVVDEPVEPGPGVDRPERLLLEVGQGRASRRPSTPRPARWRGSRRGRRPSAAAAAAGSGGSSAGGGTRRRSRHRDAWAAFRRLEGRVRRATSGLSVRSAMTSPSLHALGVAAPDRVLVLDRDDAVVARPRGARRQDAAPVDLAEARDPVAPPAADPRLPAVDHLAEDAVPVAGRRVAPRRPWPARAAPGRRGASRAATGSMPSHTRCEGS